MSPAILLFLALGLGLAGWLAARARAWAFRRDSAERRLPSLPVYHAWYVALWIILPMVAFIALWSLGRRSPGRGNLVGKTLEPGTAPPASR